MQINVSRRVLRRLVLSLLVTSSAIGLVVLGRSVTPRDAAGEPLLLSPSLKATLAYRARARGWVGEFEALDEELAALLAGNDDIYRQSQAVDRLLERSVRLAQAIEIGRAPAALAGLRELLSQTGLAYLAAAQAAAEWVGAPTPERVEVANAALAAARALLTEAGGSRWLQELAGPDGEDAGSEDGWGGTTP